MPSFLLHVNKSGPGFCFNYFAERSSVYDTWCHFPFKNFVPNQIQCVDWDLSNSHPVPVRSSWEHPCRSETVPALHQGPPSSAEAPASTEGDCYVQGCLRGSPLARQQTDWETAPLTRGGNNSRFQAFARHSPQTKGKLADHSLRESDTHLSSYSPYDHQNLPGVLLFY